MENEQNEIGVLWEKTSKNGNIYFSGKINYGGAEHLITVFYIRSENPKAPCFKIVKTRYVSSNGE